MITYQNDLIIRAAQGQTVERIPVWMMRQAGRVLPEYRAVRSTFSDFKGLLKNPDFATEVTIQPIDYFGVDAAIIFSDILVIPEALGLEYEMVEKRGPWFPNPIQTIQDIQKLRDTDGVEHLEYVIKAIRQTVQALNGRVPLIGFAGAPWTIFAYMTEGSGSKTFSKAKKWLYTQPEASHQILQKITDNTIRYLKAQIQAGAAMVQVFDSWAGILSEEQYLTFALPYMQQIATSIQEVPVTLFAKDAWYAVEGLAKTGCNTVGIDWCLSPQKARNWAGPNVTLQGNLDPCALYGSFEQVKQETLQMLQAFGTYRYIANLGHGLYPDIEKEKALCFVETVKSYVPSAVQV